MIATERTRQTMADIRDQLHQLHGDSAVGASYNGDPITVPDVGVLYSIIEQLVTRVEELESRLS
jgi:cob(I)alamin adenosyltransferase